MSNEQETPNSLEDEQVATESELEEAESGDKTAEVDVATLQRQIEGLQEELDAAGDKVIRAQAEVQNVRRRSELDLEKAHKYGVEKLVSDMVPVVDNLERALSAVQEVEDGANDDATKALIEGVELTLKTLVDGLAKHKVEVIDPHGEPFDPQLHQAMSTVENPDVEANTVINVFQKGYTLSGRLVRPAMVVVSKVPVTDPQ